MTRTGSWRRGYTGALGLGVLAAFTACHSLVGDADPPRGVAPCCGGGSGDLQVQYLGVGGWALSWNGVEIVTAPFYSNPSATRVGVRSIAADTALIDRLVPDLSQAAAILVGHAHYDHLMDVPYIARRYAPNAPVLGSRTTRNTLAGDPGLALDRVWPVNDSAGDATTPGRWIHLAGGRVRVMPLRTLHAPHFQGNELYVGTRDRPALSLPSRAADWVGGEAFAYLIDFLDSQGGVAYRVHYQDLASGDPEGLIPLLPEADRAPVDVVILCPASFQEVVWYPEGIVENAQPRHAFLGHWEDFFRPSTEPLRSVPLTDLDQFVRRLEAVLPDGSTWTRPNPGESFHISPAAAR